MKNSPQDISLLNAKKKAQASNTHVPPRIINWFLSATELKRWLCFINLMNLEKPRNILKETPLLEAEIRKLL
jgi:hypothetical protein